MSREKESSFEKGPRDLGLGCFKEIDKSKEYYIRPIYNEDFCLFGFDAELNDRTQYVVRLENNQVIGLMLKPDRGILEMVDMSKEEYSEFKKMMNETKAKGRLDSEELEFYVDNFESVSEPCSFFEYYQK